MKFNSTNISVLPAHFTRSVQTSDEWKAKIEISEKKLHYSPLMWQKLSLNIPQSEMKTRSILLIIISAQFIGRLSSQERRNFR